MRKRDQNKKYVMLFYFNILLDIIKHKYFLKKYKNISSFNPFVVFCLCNSKENCFVNDLTFALVQKHFLFIFL